MHREETIVLGVVSVLLLAFIAVEFLAEERQTEIAVFVSLAVMTALVFGFTVHHTHIALGR